MGQTNEDVMAKPLSFKNFITVDYTPGEAELTSKNAKKRKVEDASSADQATEALTTPQRLKKARQMKRYKSRIAIGRKKAEKRIAGPDVLKRRAQKTARAAIAKKMAQGVDKSELSPQRKAEIEKRMDKPAVKARIDRLVKKLIPKVRRAELERKRGKKNS
jgi:hypothetical protein